MCINRILEAWLESYRGVVPKPERLSVTGLNGKVYGYMICHCIVSFHALNDSMLESQY